MNRRPLTMGEQGVSSLKGATSLHNSNMLFLARPETTEAQGEAIGAALVYSGNFTAQVHVDANRNSRVFLGLNGVDFAWKLAPGADFHTPEAVTVYSDAGLDGMSRQFHRVCGSHLVRGKFAKAPRPILLNNWEATYFNFNEEKLLGIARTAADVGVELFVLDDGWFGHRDDDHTSLGDWYVDTKKLPMGMKHLTDQVHAMGLKFGLWFEPEMVSPKSDLYEKHPDWAIHIPGREPVQQRQQLTLDMSREDVQDYVYECVASHLREDGIDYVKWDMNRHSVAVGAKAHDYILGLYDVLRRIFLPRPTILLESCSSGGNRFDLGMLMFGPQVWCSDNTDPICRLTIQGNLSYLYPQSTFGAHVSAAPHAQTLRATPLSTRGNVSFFGCLGYELDLKHLVTIEVQEIKAQIEFYKQHRRLFQFGSFYRLKNGWQVTLDGITAAGVFHTLVAPAPGYEQLRLKGLDKAKAYRLRTRAQKLRVGQFSHLIKHVSPVSVDPNGVVLRTADKVYGLEDGAEGYRVSGAALTSGIRLMPLFRGTGYDTNQRTQGDFGSNLYLIEEDAT
jgi:alpha-galactosidase